MFNKKQEIIMKFSSKIIFNLFILLFCVFIFNYAHADRFQDLKAINTSNTAKNEVEKIKKRNKLTKLCAGGQNEAACVALDNLDRKVDGSMDASYMQKFQRIFLQKVKQWSKPIKQAATYLLTTLGTIALVIRFLPMVIKGAEFGEIVTELIKTLLLIGFWLMMILHAGEWSGAIIKGFTQLAGDASGIPAKETSPTGILNFAYTLVAKLIQSAGLWPITLLTYVVLSIVLLIIYCYIAIYILVVTIEAIIITAAGVILLGLGALDLTSDYAKRFLTYSLAVGVKLYVTLLIAGFGCNFISTWITQGGDGFFASTAAVLGVIGAVFMLAIIVSKVPELAQGMITGSSLSGGMNATGGLKSLATAAAAATVALGAAAAAAKAAGAAGGASGAGTSGKALGGAGQLTSALSGGGRAGGDKGSSGSGGGQSASGANAGGKGSGSSGEVKAGKTDDKSNSVPGLNNSSGGSSDAQGASGGSSDAQGGSGGSSDAQGASGGSSDAQGASGGSSDAQGASGGSSDAQGASGGSSDAQGGSGGSSDAQGASGGSSDAQGGSGGSSDGQGGSGGSSDAQGASGGSSDAQGGSGGSSDGQGASGGSSDAQGAGGSAPSGTPPSKNYKGSSAPTEGGKGSKGVGGSKSTGKSNADQSVGNGKGSGKSNASQSLGASNTNQSLSENIQSPNIPNKTEFAKTKAFARVLGSAIATAAKNKAMGGVHGSGSFMQNVARAASEQRESALKEQQEIKQSLVKDEE